MSKIDIKRTERQFYNGKVGRFDLVNLPKQQYLMIDGEGGPVGEAYAPSLAALYALSYGLKFHSKIELEKDYVVGPLEGLWWADDMETFISRDKSAWKWTMMIRVPEWIDKSVFADVFETALAKLQANKDPATTEEYFNAVRLDTLEEGECVQVLHVGSYDDEGPVLKEMHEGFIPSNGFAMRDMHHEIYLNDPRKISADRLKTILRQPVYKV